MKISVNATKYINQHYNSAGDPAPYGVDDLVQKIGAQLGAVEEVISFGKKYEGVLIVTIVRVADHPNADRLHVCMIDDGGKAENVERTDGLVQVVCGAPNVREGLRVAWLPPGATVPSTYDSEPFVLGARELRGVASNGMLASAKELALSDNHDGILEIDDDIAPGTLFAEAYHLTDDVIIDMENKMFTHRPDCFGWLGIAREIEGIYGRPYKSPDWYRANPEFPAIETDELKLEITNELPALVPRFTALTMRDVQVGPSPVWLQVDLARAGLRSINNIVDYTNFYMLLTGQPLHAYDYDKVLAQDADADHASIVIRHPRDGEKITLLNGREIEPRAEAIMIASRDKLIGVGGVMGGGDTEVDQNTTNIIIEAATFDMYSIRRTSMTHGLFTDAVTRFNKGQSPFQNPAVVWKIMDQIRRFAQGKVASPFIDLNNLSADAVQRGTLHAPVQVTSPFINQRLGFELSAVAMQALLTNVEFGVAVDGDTLTVAAPFWRTDIESKEDIVEEVGRLYGFDHLPLELPVRNLTPALKDPMYSLKAQVREALAKAGANEMLSYSFVHGNLLDKAGQSRDQAFQISNALSPDLQYYRLSLMPSLLDRVQPNIKAGYDEFALFEMNKAHSKHHADDDGVPREFTNVALVFTAHDKLKRESDAFYEARKFLLFMAEELGVGLEFSPLPDALGEQTVRPYQPNRSAMVSIQGSQETIGVIGEFKPSVTKSLKLPRYTAGFEVDLGALLPYANKLKRYVQLPRFPKVEQDISLKVPSDVNYQQLFTCVWDVVGQSRPDETYCMLGPVDIYQRDDDPAHKQITLRLSIASYARTLTADEVNDLLNKSADAAYQQYQAERL